MRVFIDANLLIYLNTLKDTTLRAVYEDFYITLLREHRVYTDILVLDEVLYISKKKYKIPYEITLEFIDSVVLPYTTILTLGEEEYVKASEILRKYKLKPSDSIRIAVMLNNDIKLIATEDKEYDGLEGIKRLWL